MSIKVHVCVSSYASRSDGSARERGMDSASYHLKRVSSKSHLIARL